MFKFLRYKIGYDYDEVYGEPPSLRKIPSFLFYEMFDLLPIFLAFAIGISVGLNITF